MLIRCVGCNCFVLKQKYVYRKTSEMGKEYLWFKGEELLMFQ